MYIEIVLNIKPFSINKAFLRNRTYTKAARTFRFQVLSALQASPNASKLKLIREAFIPDKHSFSVSLTSFYPLATFFNKKGTISAKTMDLTNTEKLLIDCLFSQKYTSDKWLQSRKGFERELYSPFSALQNVGYDDVYITDLKSLKRANKEASEPFQLVRIDIIPLNSL